MSFSIAFYVLMALWLVLGAGPSVKERSWSGIGSALLPWLTVLLLGWAVFGAPLHK